MAKLQAGFTVGTAAALALLFGQEAGRAHPPPGTTSELEVEVRYLEAAEERLEQGEAGAAERLYRSAFERAEQPRERLELIAPWGRAALVNRGFDRLLNDSLLNGGDDWADWELPVLRATLLSLVEDVHTAAEELLEAVDGDQKEAVRRQIADWAEEAGQVTLALPALRDAFQERESPEHHFEYVHALLEAGQVKELETHLEERTDRLAAEAEFWRKLLPELLDHEALEAAAPILTEAWQERQEDPVVSFALGELHLFRHELAEAEEVFWRVFETEEAGAAGDGLSYFQRLNRAFHNRYAVKRRIGHALNRYGTAMCREFSFLGMREDVQVGDGADARDAGLLYLRELKLPEDSTVAFLQRVEEGLDRAPRRAAGRILAFAAVGAPRKLLEEVAAFADSPHPDNASAEFALLAMNRFLLSTDRYPELRERILSLTEAMDEKVDGQREIAERRRYQEMKNRILRRLGAVEKAPVPEGEPRNREEYMAQLVQAVQAGDPEEGERLYRELEQKEGVDEEARQALVFLAQGWHQTGEYGRAAALAAEFLEKAVYPEGAVQGTVAAPLEWEPNFSFPPANPFLDFEEMEVLQGVFQVVGAGPAWPELAEELWRQVTELTGDRRRTACLTLATYHWWSEEQDEAVEAMRACADGERDPSAALLLAHLLGKQEKYGEARKVLREIAPDGQEAGQASRKLAFAFAVQQEQREEVAALAEELAQTELSASERLQVASSLASLDFAEQAGQVVEDIAGEELSEVEGKQLRQVRMQVKLWAEDEEAAARLAYVLLLADLPIGFLDLLDEPRLESLRVLQETGQLEDYRTHLRQLVGLAPRSLSLHLLLGEAAEYLWLASRRGGEESDGERSEALRYYTEAVALRPGAGDLQFELAEWASKRGLWEIAAREFDRLLEFDAQSGLLDPNLLFRTYRQAGRLIDLVDFLEEWQVPEASSLDEFYGLQPTTHLFQPLGELLLAEEDREGAERAWRKGLQINPLEFTDEMRISLAKLYRQDGEDAKLIGLVREYVAMPNPDPNLYALQPFANVVPRWMRGGSSEAGPRGIDRLLEEVRVAGLERELISAAEGWRQEHPERFSPAAFHVFLLAAADDPDWRAEWERVREQFPDRAGPVSVIREAAEVMLGL